MDGVTDTQHAFGKGMTYNGLALDEVLSRLNSPPDFASSGSLESPPAWIHRRTTNADIYFVVNQSDSPQHIDLRLRTSGLEVQIWRPMTGEVSEATKNSADTKASQPDRSGNRQPGIEPATYAEQPGLMTVALDLAEREAVFVVVGNGAAMPAQEVGAGSETSLATIHGPWTLKFPPNLGAPASVPMEELVSWTANSDPGVKYFSGTATYSKGVRAPAAWFRPGQRLFLDLGKVRDIAEVEVNGKPVGVVWAPPLKPGSNRLEIGVTNEWTNRIVGDHLLPPEKRVLSQAGTAPQRPGSPFFGPREPEDSGLMGSVKIVADGAK
jgi:hypothetical protein